MQTEVAAVAENGVPAHSNESTKKRGGKRPGAGRKPNLARRLLKGFSREAIHEAASNIDVGMVISSLLKSKREKTRLETLVFVRDTVLGRPAQNLNVSGGMLHAHIVWRPLATLSNDEIEQLDAISKKLNGPHNQIESTTTIEATQTVIDAEVCETPA
jgi:hypothetical protein